VVSATMKQQTDEDILETPIVDCDRVEEGSLHPAYRNYLEAKKGLAEAFKEGAQPAYRNYLDARKGLAEAFKQRVYQDQETCIEAERRYQLCEEIIAIANKMREKGELDALDAYREDVNKAVNKAVKKAVKKASQAYMEKIELLRIECKQRIMDAWRDSIVTSTQIADVFELDRNLKSPQHEKHEKRSFLAAIQRVVHGCTAHVSSQHCTRDPKVNTGTTL
jgi:hypothetical protein